MTRLLLRVPSGLAITLLVTAACGSSAPSPTNPEPTTTEEPRGPVSVRFHMFSEDGSGRRAIVPNQTLRSGERIAMELAVDRPVYGYVLQFFPDGSATLLFPQDGEDNRLDGTRRVPPSGWFELDDALGEETVYVVAATRPLEQADRSVLAAVEHVRTTSTPPPEPSTPELPEPPESSDPGAGSAVQGTTTTPNPEPRPVAPTPGRAKPARIGSPDPAPTRLALKSRGLKRVEDAAVIARTDADGVAIFTVTFQHVAR
jgi:hypothetical protein